MTVLTKIFYCKNLENEFKSYHNKTHWANFVWMQDSRMLLKSNSISWQKILQILTICRCKWPVVSTLCQEDEEISDPKGWIRGNTKIGPVLEVTTCCPQGKYEVEIKIMSLRRRQFSLVGQNFSWLEQTGHEFEQQWAGNLRSAVRRICVEIESEWFCKPIKG